MVVGLEQGTNNLHMVQLIPMQSYHLEALLKPGMVYLSDAAHSDCPRKEYINR